jgi:hypothetical protein
MLTDTCLTNLARRDWLADGPFKASSLNILPPSVTGVIASNHPRLSGWPCPFQLLDQD